MQLIHVSTKSNTRTYPGAALVRVHCCCSRDHGVRVSITQIIQRTQTQVFCLRGKQILHWKDPLFLWPPEVYHEYQIHEHAMTQWHSSLQEQRLCQDALFPKDAPAIESRLQARQ